LQYTYEFEMFQSEGWFVAYPFDIEGATQGKDTEEVALMAADWLRIDIEHRLMHGMPVPKATFGNCPQEGGNIMIVSIEASLAALDVIPAYLAAERLGVSRARVSQMITAGLLEGFKKGRDTYVTNSSIKARLKEAPKAGRPRKEAVAARS
jgi:predicted RNase H-like HicB family nuclease